MLIFCGVYHIFIVFQQLMNPFGSICTLLAPPGPCFVAVAIGNMMGLKTAKEDEEAEVRVVLIGLFLHFLQDYPYDLLREIKIE
jgi:hypothetical protein